jgi:murein DD-endopeptidase MepM/ murein hydrolase activator NlpD
VLVAAASTTVAIFGGPAALAQDLSGQISSKQSQLSQARSQKGVLTTTISRYSSQISQLSSQVATLRSREALVQHQLDRKQSRLDTQRHHLNMLKLRLKRSVRVLKKRLVAIYKSGTPDALTVILESNGFQDLLERADYLDRIQSQDSEIVGRVRTLKQQTADAVDRIRSARNEIRAKRDELAQTRSSLESRQSALTRARSSKQHALGQINGNIKNLEGDLSHLQSQVASQLGPSMGPSLPAGPIRKGSGQFIWPVNGPITSPFGPRTFNGVTENHPGIDIGVPTGTPIRAAASGIVRIAAPTGGYGNYTCIDHGGGISTCYGHQQRFAVSVGQHVTQGQVIGYSDCTGYCFGPHVHFEVRINGQVVDPMNYL